MTDEEIGVRIRQGEDSRTQVKRGPVGVAKLTAELTAFTNAEGGVILFGVADDDDRIELVSPGCLPNHLDIEKIKAGVSVARNPLIFNFATKEMPYRGLGTGIQRTLELGAKVEFVSDRELNVFKAILKRVGSTKTGHWEIMKP